jgi:hypothetical protein
MSDWLYDATYAQAIAESLRVKLYDAEQKLKIQRLKVYYNTDFEGQWPVGTSAVVVAESAEHAELLLTDKLAAIGLAYRGTMTEIDLTVPNAIILQDGDY